MPVDIAAATEVNQIGAILRDLKGIDPQIVRAKRDIRTMARSYLDLLAALTPLVTSATDMQTTLNVALTEAIAVANADTKFQADELALLQRIIPALMV